MGYVETQNFASLQRTLYVIISRSENGAADTNQSAAFLNGDRVILAHAHGNLLEIRVLREINGFQFLENLMQVLKFLAHLLHVVREGGHAHHTVDFNIF